MVLVFKQTTDLVLEFLLDFARFPWWWYSGGLKLVARKCWRGWAISRARVGLGIFARYLFKPMYQDYSWQGRIISFFMRIFLLVVKLVRISISGLWYLAIMAAWILLLPTALVMIFY